MNCKPNELAVVIYVEGMPKEDQQLIGLVRRVTRISTINQFGMPCWDYEGERVTMKVEGRTFAVTGLPDRVLQPLRGVGQPVAVQHDEQVPA